MYTAIDEHKKVAKEKSFEKALADILNERVTVQRKRPKQLGAQFEELEDEAGT
jgi:hypothetical protein